MNHGFTIQSPKSFRLFRRSHTIISWLDLIHELLEDLFSLFDPEGNKISEAKNLGTDKPILLKTQQSEIDLELSNGLWLSGSYSEKYYALACRNICLIYDITPCEMNIEFTPYGNPLSLPDDDEFEEESVSVVSSNPVEVYEYENNDSKGFFSTDDDSCPGIAEIASVSNRILYHEKINTAENMWHTILPNSIYSQTDDTPKPSDLLQMIPVANDNKTLLDPEWDEIIELLENDAQALSAAKLLKKSGIKPPSIMNFLGIDEYDKIDAEALFIWVEEGIAYLHGRQKYRKGFYIHCNFSHVIVDDPREVINCFK